MATIKTLFDVCKIFKTKTPLISILDVLCLCNKMECLNTHLFIFNQFTKKEMQEDLIKSGEAQKLVHFPTRAALNDQTSSPTQDALINAVENCKPVMHLTPIKRGGVRYQVPVPITDKKAQFLSMKWLIAAGKEKDRNARFNLQLAKELIDAANNTGRVVKKKTGFA
ncbi:hypothetical protein NQ314_017406 [Rhamnusium bicolor]|uniref:Small ribosomal subunit protein uS7 domain-containing protein n=1 Tax=Rhamnusium bicolor TaxID=1586634 RepID=A0AAV8WTP6_9CUCU|nr:hypothetical protein NQ314_017406 [Rhamnusium bicolor]